MAPRFCGHLWKLPNSHRRDGSVIRVTLVAKFFDAGAGRAIVAPPAGPSDTLETKVWWWTERTA
jgi:hypothetical protein